MQPISHSLGRLGQHDSSTIRSEHERPQDNPNQVIANKERLHGTPLRGHGQTSSKILEPNIPAR